LKKLVVFKKLCYYERDFKRALGLFCLQKDILEIKIYGNTKHSNNSSRGPWQNYSH
jgi:hypothetical protein